MDTVHIKTSVHNYTLVVQILERIFIKFWRPSWFQNVLMVM